MGHRILLTAMTPALLLGAATKGADQPPLVQQCSSGKSAQFQMESTIAFTSTRDGNGEI